MNKVKVFVIIPNNVEFMFLQYQLFKLFCKDEFEYIVINDCRDQLHYTNNYDSKLVRKIEEMCKFCGISCLRFPQNIHTNRKYIFPDTGELGNNPSTRHADVIQVLLQSCVFKQEDIVAFFDFDMFPIAPFSFNDMLGDAAIASIYVSRSQEGKCINYLWPNLLVFNPALIPNPSEINVDVGVVDGVRTDTGGNLYHYLRAYPDVKVNYINILSSGSVSVNSIRNDQFIPDDIKLFLSKDPKNSKDMCYADLLYEKRILHFRAGSNWNAIDASLFEFRCQLAYAQLLKLFSNNIIKE